MKKRVSLKWIFCLLGGAILFACSKDYEDVKVDPSIENIQIKNGMLVFSNHEVLKKVINGGKYLYAGYVNQFKSH
ncbi:MAG: hypothetical protein ACLU4J_04195 [Butyricimonas paravirosa]